MIQAAYRAMHDARDKEEEERKALAKEEKRKALAKKRSAPEAEDPSTAKDTTAAKSLVALYKARFALISSKSHRIGNSYNMKQEAFPLVLHSSHASPTHAGTLRACTLGDRLPQKN
jgi:hypothetical protein